MNEEEKNSQTTEQEKTESDDTSIGGGDPKSEKQSDTSKTEVKAEPAPDTPSAEELAEFRKWQESQKSEAEKQAAAVSVEIHLNGKPTVTPVTTTTTAE